MVCILAGENIADSTAAVAFTQSAHNLFCTVGVHPNALSHAPFDRDALLALLQEGRVVGIGETGLDYSKPENARRMQWEVFQAHLTLAVHTNRPVVIHCREAYDDVLAILEDFPAARFMMHMFAGTARQAEQFLARGAMLSYSGVVTFPNASDVRASVLVTPFDRLLAETDAPFLTPVPYRGKRNEPLYVEYVIRALAELKGLPWEAVASPIARNALQFFGIADATEARYTVRGKQES